MGLQYWHLWANLYTCHPGPGPSWGSDQKGPVAQPGNWSKGEIPVRQQAGFLSGLTRKVWQHLKEVLSSALWDMDFNLNFTTY